MSFNNFLVMLLGGCRFFYCWIYLLWRGYYCCSSGSYSRRL